jgi:putative PEP-CTERM system TPR-repeat lipoprotein
MRAEPRESGLAGRSEQLSSRPVRRRRAILVIACASIVLAGCDKFVSESTRVRRAEQKLDHGDYRGANLDLAVVLQRNPGNVAARLALANLSFQVGDPESSQVELERARAAGATAAAIGDLNLRLLVARGKYDELFEAAANATHLPQERRLAFAAMADQGRGKLAEAELLFRKAIGIAPADTYVQVAWARFLVGQRRTADANAVLTDVLQRDRNSADAFLLLGSLLADQGRHREARDALDRAHELAAQLSIAQQVTVLARLTETNLALGDLASAERNVRVLKARAATSLPTRFLAGRVALSRGDYATATAELREAVRVAPKHSQSRLLLAAALLGDSNFEQSEAELSQLLSEEPANREARQLLAEVYLARGRPGDAKRALLAPGAQFGDDAQSQWLMGRALLLSGNVAAALPHLQKSAAADQADAVMQTDLALAYLVAGGVAQGRAVLEQIPASQRDARATALLLMANVLGKDRAQARAGVEKMLEANSTDAVLLGVAGAYFAREGEVGRARDLLQRAIALQPGDSNARVALGAIELQSGEIDAAEQQLQAVLKAAPTEEVAYLGISEINLIRGDPARAKQVLEQAIGTIPGAVESRLRLARLAYYDKDSARARSLLDQAASLAKDRAAVLNSIGLVLLQSGRFDDALAAFGQAVRQGSADARSNVARAEIALGHTDRAQQALDAGVGADPTWVAGVALLTQIQAGQGNLKSALARISAFRGAGGRTPIADELTGDVLMTAHRFAEAAASYATAAQRAPSGRIAIKTYFARREGRLAKPIAPLEAWLTDVPNDTLARRALAEYLQVEGRAREAIAEYERILGLERSTDPVCLNNLALLYWQVGDRRAVATAERAYSARAEAPEIADTYGWMLTQSNRAKEAVPILEKAEARIRVKGEVQYHLAVAYVRTGERDKARVLLAAALNTDSASARGWWTDADHLSKSLAN